MKILLITRKFPYPINDGESIAIDTLIKPMVESGVIYDLFSLNTTKDYFHGSDRPEALSYYRNISTCDINIDVSRVGAIKNLFGQTSYFVSRYINANVRDSLSHVLREEKYDIIQFEGIHMLVYLPLIRKFSQAKVLLRAHNVEHSIWLRQSQLEHNYLKKWYLQLQANRFARFEREMTQRVDGIMPLSRTDHSYFESYNASVETISVGFQPVPTVSRFDQKKITLGFIGSMDWRPNQVGLKWFFENVWSRNIDQDISLVLAGKKFDMYPYQIPDDHRVEIMGEVGEVDLFWDKIDILIVPLFSGSGIRIKALEAMAYRKVVLSTSIGSEGIDLRSDIEGYVMDDPQLWVETINSMSSVDCTKIGANALEYIAEKHDPTVISQKLKTYYRSFI